MIASNGVTFFPFSATVPGAKTDVPTNGTDDVGFVSAHSAEARPAAVSKAA